MLALVDLSHRGKPLARASGLRLAVLSLPAGSAVKAGMHGRGLKKDRRGLWRPLLALVVVLRGALDPARGPPGGGQVGQGVTGHPGGCLWFGIFHDPLTRAGQKPTQAGRGSHVASRWVLWTHIEGQ